MKRRKLDHKSVVVTPYFGDSIITNQENIKDAHERKPTDRGSCSMNGYGNSSDNYHGKKYVNLYKCKPYGAIFTIVTSGF